MLKTTPEHLIYTDESTSRDTPLFVLAVDALLEFDYLGLQYQTTLPAGWATDFGSVPAWARWLVPNMGRWDPAYVLHDWLYSKACPLALTRNDADTILWLKLKELGMSGWKANIVYQAVQYGGKSAWRRRS